MAGELTAGSRLISTKNRYEAIIEAIFLAKHERGQREVAFERQDIISIAAKLNIDLPKNLGDLIYSFRYRTELPPGILAQAPAGQTWIIRPAGRSKYRFVLVPDVALAPNPNLAVTKIPDSTPGIIAKYAFSDEQAVLARVRHNRLIDIFLGIACYSLQSHFRTTVPGMGQVETDELYVGLDKSGSHYVVPVQAKGGNDRLNRVQIEQDLALCADKLPSLICRPVGTQSMRKDQIALFEFVREGDDIRIASEKHYRLVPPDDVTNDDLAKYTRRLEGGG